MAKGFLAFNCLIFFFFISLDLSHEEESELINKCLNMDFLKSSEMFGFTQNGRKPRKGDQGGVLIGIGIDLTKREDCLEMLKEDGLIPEDIYAKIEPFIGLTKIEAKQAAPNLQLSEEEAQCLTHIVFKKLFLEIKLIYNDLIGPQETKFESLTTSQRTVIFSIFYWFGINLDNNEFHEDDSINEFYKAVIEQDWDDAIQSLKAYRRPRYQKVRRREERHLLEANTDSGECPCNETTTNQTTVEVPTPTPTPTSTTPAATTTATGICVCSSHLFLNYFTNDSIAGVVFSGQVQNPEYMWFGASGPFSTLYLNGEGKGIIDIFPLYPTDVSGVSYQMRYIANTTLTTRNKDGKVIFSKTLIFTTESGFVNINFFTTLCDAPLVTHLTIEWGGENDEVNIRNLRINACFINIPPATPKTTPAPITTVESVTICTCDVSLVLNDSNHDAIVDVIFSGSFEYPENVWLGATGPYPYLYMNTDGKGIVDIVWLYPRDVFRVSYQMRYIANTTLTIKDENGKVLFMETMIFTTGNQYVNIDFFTTNICGVQRLTIDWGSEDNAVKIKNLAIEMCIIDVTTPTMTPPTTTAFAITVCGCDFLSALNNFTHDSHVEVIFSGQFQNPENVWIGASEPYPTLFRNPDYKGIVDIYSLYPRDVSRVSYQMRFIANTTLTIRDENGKVLFVETKIFTPGIEYVDINFNTENLCIVKRITIDWDGEIDEVNIRNLAIYMCTTIGGPPPTPNPTLTTAEPAASCDSNFFNCASCICLVSGNECLTNDTQICNNMPNCIMKDGSCACGVFQITESYFNECNTTGDPLPINYWYDCALDPYVCATICVYNYVQKYGSSCTGKNQEDITCLEYARIHFGGPNGCNNEFPAKEILNDCCAQI